MKGNGAGWGGGDGRKEELKKDEKGLLVCEGKWRSCEKWCRWKSAKGDGKKINK